MDFELLSFFRLKLWFPQIQNMRIGAMMKTVLSALAQAVLLHRSFSAGQAPDKELAKLKPKLQVCKKVQLNNKIK